ncbi:MAG: hypothetical protein K8I60_21625 [Anaerolineae bacterium]|nr:hypothetical protein [Anaerolineae bacterium]
MSQFFSDFLRIGFPNHRDQTRINLNLIHQIGDLVIHHLTADIDVAAPNAVVGCATAGSTGIRCRTREPGEVAGRLILDIDQPLQQIGMPSLHDPVPVTIGQDFQPAFEFFSGDNRFPASFHRLGGNTGALADNPPGIEPVVKPLGQTVGRGFAPLILDFNEGATGAIAVATSVQRLADISQGVVVREE